MPRTARVNDAVLADTALAIIETEGPEHLTISTLASALGVKPPSLYNHVASIEDVRMHVRIIAATRLGDLMIEASMGRSGEEALIALCHAYRGFRPGQPGPLRHDNGTGGRAERRPGPCRLGAP